MANDYQETKVVFPCRFSYVHVWEPTSVNEGDEKKYNISCIIPKSDKKTVAAIKKAIQAAFDAGLQSKFGGKPPKKWKNPLRDGDEDRDDEAYENAYFVGASCKTQPGVVDKNRQPITDPDEFYSGCYGYVSINFYAYNTNGGIGVAAGLNNVMKVKDGDPLGGRISAEADFAGLEPDEDDFDDDDL